MSELTTRIRRVTEDLKAIHQELGSVEAAGVSGPENNRALDELLNLELLDEFKQTIDLLRHFLWSYIEAYAQQSGTNTMACAATLRLQRATEMLRSLSFEALHNGGPNGEITFFQLIEQIAESIVNQHEAPSSQSQLPAAPIVRH